MATTRKNPLSRDCLWKAAAVVWISACTTVAASPDETPVTVDIPPKPMAAATISPYIFGFGYYGDKDRDKAGVWVMKPSLYRYGGNSAERYNWQINATNSANDYFYLNHSLGDDASVDAFLKANQAHGVASSIVLPLLGWVAKDATSTSYPHRDFPQQQQFEAWGRDAGNGFDKAHKPLNARPAQTSIAAGPAFLAAWVQHLKTRFGAYPHFYILGNEPMLWGETHRDVHPEPTTYDEYLGRFLAAATAVRQADPAAVIIGPADWGWLPVFHSQADGHGGHDQASHGDKPFLEWFLGEVAKAEAKQHLQLLDVVDMHYYPSDLDLYKDGPFDTAMAKARIASTRSLWDRDHKETGWIKKEVYFVPLLKEIVARTKPSLRVAIGEYNFHGEATIDGGITLAEVLRIFVSEGVYMAEYWTEPKPASAAGTAFRLYRNYDGQGAAFGGEILATSLPNTGDLTAVAARAQSGHRINVVLINKSTSDYQRLRLTLNQLPVLVKTVTSYKLSSKDLLHLQPDKLPAAREQRLVLPPLSATMVEFTY